MQSTECISYNQRASGRSEGERRESGIAIETCQLRPRFNRPKSPESIQFAFKVASAG